MADLFDGAGRAETDLNGVRILHGYLDRPAQEAMVEDIRRIAESAPFRQYKTARGKSLSVRMTAAGAVGWMTDAKGYRYSDRQPDGREWPGIPASIMAVWRDVVGHAVSPDSCLVNYYGEDARMGLHQDRDEADLSHPVISISLGDPGLFRVGGTERGGPTRSVWLHSGAVLVMEGAARLVHHGVDRIKFGESDLLSKGGRINLTLRVAR